MVTAHIDPVGVFTGPGWYHKPEGLPIGIAHLICYSHYKRVVEIRDGLLSQQGEGSPVLVHLSLLFQVAGTDEGFFVDHRRVVRIPEVHQTERPVETEVRSDAPGQNSDVDVFARVQGPQMVQLVPHHLG